jgi:protein deglycase
VIYIVPNGNRKKILISTPPFNIFAFLYIFLKTIAAMAEGLTAVDRRPACGYHSIRGEKTMKTAVVFLAEGFEEVEALTPVDYLRRAGIEVKVAGIGSRDVVGSHGIGVLADTTVDELSGPFDCVIVPGGMPGAKNIAADEAAVAIIKDAFEGGRLVAAICAAPAVVLANAARILEGRMYTCYPGMERESSCGIFRSDRVVIDGNLVTARAAGVAGEFAAAIVEVLAGAKAARELEGKVLLTRG